MRGFFYICEYFRISPSEFFEFDARYPDSYGSIVDHMKLLDQEEIESLDKIVTSMAEGKPGPRGKKN